MWRDAGGQVRRGGDRLDAVPVLVQQVPGLVEGSSHRAAAGAEQVGESVVGQAEAQVEHRGHDAVGEGEDRWPAGAGLVPGVAGGWLRARCSRWACRRAASWPHRNVKTSWWAQLGSNQ